MRIPLPNSLTLHNKKDQCSSVSGMAYDEKQDERQCLCSYYSFICLFKIQLHRKMQNTEMKTYRNFTIYLTLKLHVM